jgi:hypothetical protein
MNPLDTDRSSSSAPAVAVTPRDTERIPGQFSPVELWRVRPEYYARTLGLGLQEKRICSR